MFDFHQNIRHDDTHFSDVAFITFQITENYSNHQILFCV